MSTDQDTHTNHAEPADNGQSWHKHAVCRPGNGHDPETWFPAPPSPWSTREENRIAVQRRIQLQERAKAICQTCPVQLECLQWAVDHDERTGIWGGQTEAERGVTPIR